MNKQAERLFKAIKDIKGVTGKTEIAKMLHVTPQLINNWEKRGLSRAGREAAQKYVGISARWLETGIGSVESVGKRIVKPSPSKGQKQIVHDDSISAIVIMLAHLDRDDRLKLIGKMEVWIEDVLKIKQNDRRNMLLTDRRSNPRKA